MQGRRVRLTDVDPGCGPAPSRVAHFTVFSEGSPMSRHIDSTPPAS
jgi:hypothetical protein